MNTEQKIAWYTLGFFAYIRLIAKPLLKFLLVPTFGNAAVTVMVVKIFDLSNVKDEWREMHWRVAWCELLMSNFPSVVHVHSIFWFAQSYYATSRRRLLPTASAKLSSVERRISSAWFSMREIADFCV